MGKPFFRIILTLVNFVIISAKLISFVIPLCLFTWRHLSAAPFAINSYGIFLLSVFSFLVSPTVLRLR